MHPASAVVGGLSPDAVRGALQPVAILVDGSTHQVTRTVKIDGICVRAICVPKRVLAARA